MKVIAKRLAFGLMLLFATSLAGQAQTQITTGVIQGTVSDETNAVIPGTVVEARNLGTNLAKSLSTDENGRFVLLQLQPGRYTLTASKTGYTTLVQENLTLTVGQAITLHLTLKVSQVQERITITAAPTIDIARIESSSTLNETSISTTPILGRKFEDLLTLTPGVSITQGPDGDAINFNGQRGIYNNVSLDGGDYNNGFFGEQVGGQRAAIDITLEAVKEFQVVATGASAEFGRTAGGVVNAITKSGTNEFHGSLFHFQRHEALTSNTSDGKPLTDFHREQFGGTLGGPIVKEKIFYFAAFEQITGNLQRDNLSAPIGTPCSVANPTIQANEALIVNSQDCQRLALINFFRTSRNQIEGDPVRRPVHNTAFLGKWDWKVTSANDLAFSYNFNRSNKINETFDVPTYGNSANGIEGPSRIQVANLNLFTTLSSTKLNEFHFTYSREQRPRSAVQSNVPADTAVATGLEAFRFGNPFFLQPGVDELFWRSQVKDNVSLISGKHTVKTGFEWIHSRNSQVFRGFFTGRYIFDSVAGFLHYASPASLGAAYGPNIRSCAPNPLSPQAPALTAYVQAAGGVCPAGTLPGTGPLSFYLQAAGPNGPATDAAGASDVSNEEFGLFVQDKWQVTSILTLSYGLRWDAQTLPDPVVAPSATAYGRFLNDPRFPSDGTLPSQWKMFQPRVGFSWDLRGNGKSVVRGSWGIYNARLNMLSQVGSITTNGVQQTSVFRSTANLVSFNIPTPVWPNVITPAALPPGQFPDFTGVRVFSRNYANPRIYTTNVAFEQEIARNLVLYFDFTHSKGVHLTRFLNVNRNGFFTPQLDEVMVASALGKGLYRGLTIGMRKRFSNRFQFEGNYVLSKDLDDDSNERDPFTDRSFDINNLQLDYALSDRDIRHKFNFYLFSELYRGLEATTRIQARSAQPFTDGNRTATNRNSSRKDNQFFSLDWSVRKTFKIGERFKVIPLVEMFNTTNSKNNINPLTAPAVFNFDGFLRQGVGDPRQLQLAVRFTF
ncbi:MAG TPA: carboxypeptidase regulatory-like domain-containing protein [Blastocatellia bacterium]|nr:carboxypeptidase regulatory-like domain-containing protein [Blastocatellia bacterium]